MKKLEGLFTSQWGALMESLVELDLVAVVAGPRYQYIVRPEVRGRRLEHY